MNVKLYLKEHLWDWIWFRGCRLSNHDLVYTLKWISWIIISVHFSLCSRTFCLICCDNLFIVVVIVIIIIPQLIWFLHFWHQLLSTLGKIRLIGSISHFYLNITGPIFISVFIPSQSSISSFLFKIFQLDDDKLFSRTVTKIPLISHPCSDLLQQTWISAGQWEWNRAVLSHLQGRCHSSHTRMVLLYSKQYLT
jgi:hypothetical protein